MNDRNDLIIGIDSSTSACKTVIYDTNGACVAEGKSSLSIAQPVPGWHEQPAGLWWRALKNSTLQALRSVDASRLKGVAIAHQRESFVPVDSKGVPLRPGILWMDERAASELPGLEKLMGGEEFHAVTGKPLSGNLTIAKIAWLRQPRAGCVRPDGIFPGCACFPGSKTDRTISHQLGECRSYRVI